MAINIFLVYMGGLLAGSIVLFTLTKKFVEVFDAGGKKPVLYGSISSLLASLAAYASTYISNNLFSVFWALAGIFLLFGIVHMIIVHKKYFQHKEQNNTKVFIGELFFAMSIILFTVCVFSSLQYFLKDNGKNFLFYPIMMSTFAFFIPVLLMQTFEAAYSIPARIYNTWMYPEVPIDLPEDDPREKLLVIGFEIAKKKMDIKKTYFRAKAPENIYLGDLYYFFINDYNEVQSETPIEFLNINKEPYQWIFLLKRKWYQANKILDPFRTVKDNGVKENSVIISERI